MHYMNDVYTCTYIQTFAHVLNLQQVTSTNEIHVNIHVHNSIPT